MSDTPLFRTSSRALPPRRSFFPDLPSLTDAGLNRLSLKVFYVPLPSYTIPHNMVKPTLTSFGSFFSGPSPRIAHIFLCVLQTSLIDSANSVLSFIHLPLSRGVWPSFPVFPHGLPCRSRRHEYFHFLRNSKPRAWHISQNCRQSLAPPFEFDPFPGGLPFPNRP